MATQKPNPFVLPGFGQSGDMAQNPIMASMEMMRQAWQGLAATSGLEQAAMATPMSLEELDRRIADLRAVENWLRLNLSMLSSTIQGMEVQRSTIATLKSFMSTAAQAGQHPEGRSPLDVVLGLHPEGEAPAAKAPAGKPQTEAQQEADASAPADAAAAQASAAAQGWWDMLQKQFDTLAAATTATLHNAESSAASSDAPRKAARKSATGSAPRKTATKKAAARKRASTRGSGAK